MHSNARLRALAVLLALALGLTACGGDDEGAEEETEGAEEETEAAAGEEVEVTAVDYAFEGAPATATAGTKLTFVNASEKEAHEMVLMRINDDEERPLKDLLALPQEEAEKVAQFQGVAFAFPGEETMYPEGETTLKDAGRYAIICFIPVGADVAKMKESMAAQEEGGEEGPPEMGEGPPHFTQGMAAEIVVS